MPMLWAMLNIVLNACSATLAEDSGLRVLFVFIHFLVSLLFSRKVMHFSDLNAKKMCNRAYTARGHKMVLFCLGSFVAGCKFSLLILAVNSSA